jgi:ABC-type lipoprotein export system ATPase subunit
MNINIEKHIENLSDKNLNILNKKYIVSTILTYLFKELFYWLLIYFSDRVFANPDLLYYYSKIILLVLVLQIPIEKYSCDVINQLITKIKISNSIYFYKRLQKVSKNKILKMDLIEYNNIIEHFNDNIEQYILNKKIIYSLPLRFVGLCIISYNKNLKYLISAFFVYFYILKQINQLKYDKEKHLIDEIFFQENKIREYITNSKNLLLNDNINIDYIENNINKYEDYNYNINNYETIYETVVNIIILLYTLFIMGYNRDKLDPKNFLYYFLIVFDIEYVADKITAYYKNKIQNIKLEKRLNYLYNYNPETSTKSQSTDINKIVITKILCVEPKLQFNNITISKNDHILISGVSGSGKTSFLYIFKDIIKPEYIDMCPSISILASLSYLSRAEDNNLPSGKLYDIISNYQTDANTDLIKYAIRIAKYKTDTNNYINTNVISSGEKVRLIIARLIYIINTYDYKILLFDEIDEHLNNDLALYICDSVRSIFKNKIILYITHNDAVKKKFDKVITFDNGKNLVT